MELPKKTLIEAARTMLEDSLLPILFWAEAVIIACYVKNRVLVTNPQNKIPYELLLGRSPGIEPKWLFDIDTLTMFMNYQPVVAGNQPTDNAGIKENLDAGNVGKETIFAQQYMLLPLWSTGLQDPHNTDNDVTNAAFEVKKNENDVHVSANGSNKSTNKKHDEKAKRDDKGKSHVDLPTGVRDLRAKFKEFSFNSTNRDNAVSVPVNAAGLNPTNSTNNFNIASPSINAVSPNFGIVGKSSFVDPSTYPDDLDMPELEDIVYSDDGKDVGAEADLSNLEINIPASPIPTTRVHKDYPDNQIIVDLNLAPQTRSMTRMVKEQDGLHQINNEDFHTCMFACFISQEETKKVHQALKDPSWIEAIQKELLQFKLQMIWVLVDLPKGKRDIGSKWVFRDKKDERGIVIRNKARLVAHGHTQEEGIDYDEVFASIARIEAIWLFLAFASFMGFMVYKVVKALYGLYQAPRAWYETLAIYLLENGCQRGKIDQTLFIKRQKGDILLVQVYVDDIIFRSTNKELCKAFEKLMKDKFQISSIEEITFFLGLQVKQKDDGIFISQDKYVAKILKKFRFTNVKLPSTPIKTEKPLLKDPDGEDVDVNIYRTMIRSLMYLTSFRPDIMSAVYACARFQVTLKVSHFHVVKRIFRYLKGKPYLGLWYPKDSLFNLVAFFDSDYAGASLDRKSTTRGCQFLVMSSDSHATITYTSMSSYEVIVNGLHTGPEYPEYLPPADDVLPAEEQPLPTAVSPTAESPGYIADSEPEMDPKEEDGDDKESEEESIDYPTSKGDDDANDDGDDLSDDNANDEDEEESSDREEEEEEHLALTVSAPALYSSTSTFEETEPFEEGETAATAPPFGYLVASRISVQPHILMPFHSESEVERLLAIPTPPLSPVSPTSYSLPPFLMPLPIFTPLSTLSFPLPLLIPSTSGSESIPEADIPLRKRARFTTPTGGYEIGESSVAAAARQIRPTLTIAESRRADDRLIGRLRRERQYFRTLSTTYAWEVAHSRDYCTQIMDYCQS
nr:hypothetical protein [Tanacetum cinerariifolium]